MLAASSTEVPAGAEWVYEPKWDGFRALATVSGGKARLASRNGNDLTARFAAVAEALPDAIRVSDAVLDGEVCALDSAGASRFGLLQGGEGQLMYAVFDVLEVEGESLITRPLEERRALLEGLVAPTSVIALTPWFDDGEALLEGARSNGLEGLIAKRRNGKYRPGLRSSDWQKVKLQQRQEFVVVGWTDGSGRRAGDFGALVLAVRDSGRLRYVGNVGSGFSDAELGRLRAQLDLVGRDLAPLDEVPRLPRVAARAVHWVEPRLVVEVEFAEWTRDGRLRAPVYLGLRDDRDAESVTREMKTLPSEIRRGKRTLRLSNLEKPFWPEEGITKGDLLSYYRAVAPVVIPHLRGRPFTMKRFPDGWQGKSFFQKDTPKHAPDWLKTAPFPATSREGETRVIDYALVEDELALLWVVSMGCIELHTWTSRADLPGKPDWVIFDLDPSEGCGFGEVVEVALLLHELLELIGLRAYPKTSGSRGLHVLVPITRRHDHAQAREFAATIGAALERAHPGLVTTQWSKAKRVGVLVDANQNGPGKTTAAVYSVRPRAGAPVSTPLQWDELVPDLDPARFTIDGVIDRVARLGDLFAPVLDGGQSLTAALKSIS
jgi:bifunctional non-homologous end joining protein LigD